MDPFVVSARKYRPATFDTVVGQQAITGTLKNAIRNNQLAQAFLFTGPRGVGKTTCARILAKTINCFNISEEIEACNVCESCLSFNRSHSFNVHELDAASNNSVDGIRALVDQVRIPPQLGKYKVYIIDEVHMLSQAAFNAFLKTLEEPPAYAKFILATTEKHKIIATILSRCQIYDFARITVRDIAAQLAFIAEKENIKAEPTALHMIAQKADGAMRDALSMFDQLVSYTGNSLTYKQVTESLNVLDSDFHFRVMDMLLEGQNTGILLLVDEVFSKGFQGSDFIAGFGEHLRNLLVARDAATMKLLEVSDEMKGRYVAQTGRCTEDFLLDALDINARTDVQYRNSQNKRLLIELSFLQTAGLLKKKITEPLPAALPDPAISKSAPRPAVVTPESPEVSVQLPSESKPKDITPPPEIRASKVFSAGKLSLRIKPQETESDDEPDELMLPDAEMPCDAYSLENFLSVWKDISESVREESPAMYLAMTRYEPAVGSDHEIVMFLDNVIQEDMVKEKKPEILHHLRRELNNYAIRIETRIQSPERQTKAYLPKDKLEKMTERNPEIKKLQQNLDLDLLY